MRNYRIVKEEDGKGFRELSEKKENNDVLKTTYSIAQKRDVIRSINPNSYHCLADERKKRIITILYPEAPELDDGYEHCECANKDYFKNMSIEIKEGKAGIVYLHSHFIFTNIGIEHARPFLTRNSKSANPHSRYFVPIKIRKDIPYKGGVYIGEHATKFEVNRKANGDLDLIINTYINSKEEIPLTQEVRKNRRIKQTLVKTTDEINELFYKSLINDYEKFKPVLK